MNYSYYEEIPECYRSHIWKLQLNEDKKIREWEREYNVASDAGELAIRSRPNTHDNHHNGHPSSIAKLT